jgi:hypothetical protein
MKQVQLEIGDSSDLRLKALAHQWGVPPGRVVDLLCQSIDREFMARLAVQAMSGTLITTEDGVARMPARRPPKSNS